MSPTLHFEDCHLQRSHVQDNINFVFFHVDLMFLICWMLHPDPLYRIIMQDLLRNPWLTQPVDINMYSFTSVVGTVPNFILDSSITSKLFSPEVH